jgi:mycoredoxin
MPENKKIVMYGTHWCGGCGRARQLLNQHHIPYDFVNVDEDESAAKFVESVNRGFRSVPTIVWPDGSILTEPSMFNLAKKLGVTYP